MPVMSDPRYIDRSTGQTISHDPAHEYLHDSNDRPPPDWVDVSTSSNLGRVRYVGAGWMDALDVYFHTSNKTYRYFDVPWSVYWGLLSASSRGTYHHQHIKWTYTFTEI